ncbi:SDR family oxidoreductase [Pigmentiphaga sp. GD03639]|uniref:SDR family NAD(P)-dependent oxidoreductase n=1 Tax=unclassified Pigmentiphaga TaxID=2626614 RepID=UPI002448E32A|nr:SDR family NAD(P)-dependent oxidoreductase [Pigmentiphaga sp. GD03639]MDH2234788.1 SDR family oxidoreductase [Pigmentiphaga sp. GD03639]
MRHPGQLSDEGTEHARRTSRRQGNRLRHRRRLGHRLHRVQAAAGELSALGLDAQGYVADVRDREALAGIMDGEGRVDVVVCAAGVYTPRQFDEISDEDFRRTVDVNLLGVFVPAQEGARRMRPGGRIVTVSSRGALGGYGFADYVASKAGVIGLTRAMALELRPRRIAVNSIAPGFTDTPMTRTMPPDQYAKAVALEPGGAPATPDDIAVAIEFFASPATKFITGQTLFVDGGKSLGGLGI